MNPELTEIKKLLRTYSSLEHTRTRIKSKQYICEKWDTYTQDYTNICKEIKDTKQLIVEACNNYINYPQKKFLFFDITKKVEFKDCYSFNEDMLYVPFVDKREYYCLISLFDSSHLLWHLYTGEYYLK